ncbi:MAG TPA: multicopper oxidase domain-containing protein, partial [Anaerolineales bacterium]|nr:multicopper oxidase domain-containing protein [Anaerolineales bacterium]
MRQLSFKHRQTVITAVALMVWGFVLAACGSMPVGLPQANATANANAGTEQFINKHLVLENPLFIPPLLEPRIENGEKVFDLAVQEGETEFFQGRLTQTMGFNGTYLGPTLRARTGDNVRLSVTNNLAEPTTAHWHGMHLPAAMDGGPHQMIQPGEIWQPHWTIGNEAATLWYHPHLMGKTGEQVYRGLAGFFL